VASRSIKKESDAASEATTTTQRQSIDIAALDRFMRALSVRRKCSDASDGPQLRQIVACYITLTATDRGEATHSRSPRSSAARRRVTRPREAVKIANP
jgi:hypothetical protein